MSISFFAVGNEELEKAKPLGKTIKCPRCGKRHRIKYGDKVLSDGTKVPSTSLAFYKCGSNSYLAGINGKQLDFKKEEL